MDGAPRAIWRLVSPGRHVLSCDVVRDGAQFQLRVCRDVTPLLTYPAASLDALDAVASEWRAALCARGYAPAPSDEQSHQSLLPSGEPSPDPVSASNPLREDRHWRLRHDRRT
ncbi:MAG TPA: hypothetical protein VFZ36_00935 [Vicinamibacterales bacterium]